METPEANVALVARLHRSCAFLRRRKIVSIIQRLMHIEVVRVAVDTDFPRQSRGYEVLQIQASGKLCESDVCDVMLPNVTCLSGASTEREHDHLRI